MTNIDPTGNYCVSADGKYALGGECNSPTSIYFGDVKVNYWDLFVEDYLYVSWLTTDDPNFWPSLDPQTQQLLRKRILKGYMEEQINQGFPDFFAGLNIDPDGLTKYTGWPAGSMSYKDVVKFLEKSGFKRVGQDGSHVKLKGPNGEIVIVPVHGNKSLPKGTLRSIMEQAKFK